MNNNRNKKQLKDNEADETGYNWNKDNRVDNISASAYNNITK